MYKQKQDTWIALLIDSKTQQKYKATYLQISRVLSLDIQSARKTKEARLLQAVDLKLFITKHWYLAKIIVTLSSMLNNNK